MSWADFPDSAGICNTHTHTHTLEIKLWKDSMHTVRIYCGKFSRVQILIRGMVREPSEEIFVFQCQETIPTNKLCMWNTDAWEFISVCVDCSSLEKRENFPLYGTLHVLVVCVVPWLSVPCSSLSAQPWVGWLGTQTHSHHLPHSQGSYHQRSLLGVTRTRNGYHAYSATNRNPGWIRHRGRREDGYGQSHWTIQSAGNHQTSCAQYLKLILKGLLFLYTVESTLLLNQTYSSPECQTV